MYDNEFETKENKIWTKDEIEPQHIHLIHKKTKLNTNYPSSTLGLMNICPGLILS